jgi:GNAT superfamily N-acetyltransferase
MIRGIVKDDIPFIVQSLQQMRTESITGQQSADDPEYVTANLNSIFDGEGFFGYVYGEQYGYMFGTITPLWFCAKLRAYEQSLYVRPDRRGSIAAVTMITAFRDECIRRGAVDIYAGGYAEIKTDKLFKLYERLGFERYGLGIRYRIKE